jgi:hypothetical protein
LAFLLFYYFYLDYYLFQFRLKCNFNPDYQTITEDGDKFYYTYKNEDFLLSRSIYYTVYYYRMIDKFDNKCVDLDSAIYSADHMTNDQIRNDAILSKTRNFFMNYSTSNISDDLFYTDLFNKIKRAFTEK